MFWTGTRAKVKALRDEVEELRRSHDRLRYDMEQLADRVQKWLWRNGKSAQRAAAAAASTAIGLDSPESTAPGASATAPLDPVSAAIMARRNRGRVRSPVPPMTPEPPQPPSDSKEGDEHE